MIKVIANSNPRDAINEVNERGISKKDILSIVYDTNSKQLLIIYEV